MTTSRRRIGKENEDGKVIERLMFGVKSKQLTTEILAETNNKRGQKNK